ncbi:MAG: MFS transporter [Orrella sp.]|jgi:MFS transporter, YNFM family, putative membrane transport protein
MPDSPPTVAKTLAPNRRMVWLLALASFASTSTIRVLDPALPQLALAFDITTGQAAKVVTVFAIAYGLMLFVFGPIGDRFGKYKTLSLTTLACSVSSLLVALAPSFEWLLVARVVSAITGAAIVPLSMAWIGDHIPYEQRQTTLAQFTIGTILGITSGQFIGGIFTDTVGWQGAFYFLAVLFLIVGSILWSQRHLAQEVPSTAGTKGWRAIVLPVVTVLKVRWARVVVLTVLLEGALVFGVLSYIPSFLQERHGMSPSAAGATAGLFAVGAFVYVFNARWLVARLGEIPMVRLGGILVCLCYVTYLFAPGWGWALLASAVTGLGYYFVHAVLQTRATQMAPSLRGTAVSLSSSCLLLGQAIGVSLGAIVVDRLGIDWLLGIAMVGFPVLILWFVFEASRHKDQDSR